MIQRGHNAKQNKREAKRYFKELLDQYDILSYSVEMNYLYVEYARAFNEPPDPRGTVMDITMRIRAMPHRKKEPHADSDGKSG